MRNCSGKSTLNYFLVLGRKMQVSILICVFFLQAIFEIDHRQKRKFFLMLLGIGETSRPILLENWS